MLFPLEENGGQCCACCACVLDPAHGVTAIDRRGDILRTPERIACELDAQTAIVLHLENGDSALPADYAHVLRVLDALARADYEMASTITELRSRYEQAAFFSPKQMLLAQWRLTKHGIEHGPSRFVVSVRTDKEIAQIRNLCDWQKRNLAPYLSWEQRSKFGF